MWNYPFIPHSMFMIKNDDDNAQNQTWVRLYCFIIRFDVWFFMLTFYYISILTFVFFSCFSFLLNDKWSFKPVNMTLWAQHAYVHTCICYISIYLCVKNKLHECILLTLSYIYLTLVLPLYNKFLYNILKPVHSLVVVFIVSVFLLPAVLYTN